MASAAKILQPIVQRTTTGELTMTLTYQTVMRSCYKPGKILLLNARWERTSPCYSSAVITFSSFPGELDTILPGL